MWRLFNKLKNSIVCRKKKNINTKTWSLVEGLKTRFYATKRKFANKYDVHSLVVEEGEGKCELRGEGGEEDAVEGAEQGSVEGEEWEGQGEQSNMYKRMKTGVPTATKK